MRTPSQCFNSSRMLRKFADWSIWVVWPYHKLVVITSTGQIVTIKRPLKSTYLLCMTFVFVYYWTLVFSQIPENDIFISWTWGKEIGFPSKRTDSFFVSCNFVYFWTLQSIPNFCCSLTCSNSNVCTIIVPVDTRDRMRT